MLLASTLLVAAVAAVAAAHAQPTDDAARMRLVSERTHLTPGQENWIGVAFEIRPRWHLYWRGQNDTGSAPEVELSLPEGFTAGEIAWPAPKRHLTADEILDHIYEDRVTLLVPIRVPADAAVGSRVYIGASGRWMVCEDVCMLGEGEAAIELPIGAAGQARPSADARLFDEARARLPQPVPRDNPPFTLEWTGSGVAITAPGAERLAFYPGEKTAGFQPFLTQGEAKGERLILAINPDTDGPVRLDGVLEITRPKPAPPSIVALKSERPAGNRGGG